MNNEVERIKAVVTDAIECEALISPHDVQDLLREVYRLQKENEQLRTALIKTPDELHAVSATVEKWGFGIRTPVDLLRET